MYRSNVENDVEEIQSLVQALDISASDAIEIINIYFEFFAEEWKYIDYLYENIRVVKETEENRAIIDELCTVDDACLFEGDDYVLITNYHYLVKYGIIGDVFNNPF